MRTIGGHDATSQRVYDPLSVDELGKSAVRTLMDYPACELPPKEIFSGCGVYTIHYHGDFRAYTHLDGNEPIYVGKAEPPGKRQGERSKAQHGGPRLYQRLEEHSRSIRKTYNLDPLDFKCRWLVLEPVWIGLTEQTLITEYLPLWNVVVNGFGIHNPGRGRLNQRRSPWDTLHPGRPWASQLADNNQTIDTILASIQDRRKAS